MKLPFTRTFTAHIHYKSGTVAHIRAMKKLKVDKGTWEWETIGPDKIFALGIDEIAAIHYTVSPILADLWYAIYRRLP